MEHLHNTLKSIQIHRAIREGLKEELGEKEVVCDKHGPYLTSGTRYLGKHEVWSKCAGCVQDQKHAEEEEKQRQEVERQKAHIAALVMQSAIPARFVGRSFDNFSAETPEQVAALSIARSFAEDFDHHYKRGSGLVFSGMPGTGKSHLAAAILQALLPKYCGMYTTCMTLIRTVRGTWRRDSEKSEAEVLDLFKKVPLLVIDEIGVQYGTDGEQTILFDVLDGRYQEMMPTILLTNQAKQGFKEFIGDRSFDRLTETSKWIAFDWKSYRPQARTAY